MPHSPVPAQAVGSGEFHAPKYTHVEPFGEGYKISVTAENIRVELLTLGAALNSVQVRNPHVSRGTPEEWTEVLLGYTTPAEAARPDAVIGATVGRFAGRIADAEFSLNDTKYELPKNWVGKHNLHGGPNGFNHLQWKYLCLDGEDEITVSFHLTSPHLDQGFPGEVFVTCTYSLSKVDTTPLLRYNYQVSLAENTPADETVVNLTNHAYWNLNGVPRPVSATAAAALPSPVTNHWLKVPAKFIAVVDEECIPTGEMLEVEGSAHDYSKLRCIANGISRTEEMGREPSGYDDPVALETWDSTLREAAVLYSPATRLQMKVCTTNPAVVIYTANYLPPDADGSAGRRFQKHSGICLECQYFPNSPNMNDFPTTVLKKGETYVETTTHEFQFLHADPRQE